MMDAAVASVLPLKRYAEFRGRSRRAELLAFLTLLVALSMAIGLGGAIFGIGLETQQWARTGLTLFLACPLLALSVRRLHDTGRSGWWLLLAAPAVTAAALEFFARPGPWTAPAHIDFPWWIDLPLGLSGVALAVLLLLDDDVDDNRYGPNPRGWPQGSPA